GRQPRQAGESGWCTRPRSTVRDGRPAAAGPQSSCQRPWARTARSADPLPRDGRTVSAAASELTLKRRDLVRAEATDPPVLGDADPLHDLAGTDLADARHRLEQRRDLHLADDVVLLAFLKHLGQSGAGVLQTVLDLSALAAGLRRLGQCGRTLFRGQGRERHGRFTSGSVVVIVRTSGN